MANVEVKLNPEGLIELAKSPEVQAMLKAEAEKIVDKASAEAEGLYPDFETQRNAPYTAHVRTLDRSAIATVVPSNQKGIKAQAEYKTLSKYMH